MVYFLLLAGFFNILLAFVVLYSKRKNLNSKLFFFFALLSGCWVIINFFEGISPIIFLFRSSYAVAVFLVSACVVWIIYFTSGKFSGFRSLALYLSGFSFALLAQFTNLIIADADNITFGGGDASYGVFFPFYSLYIISILFLSLFSLFLQYRNSSGIRRNQILYVFFGLVIYALIATLASIILPFFGVNQFIPLDSASSIFFVILTSYAILRYRFMDIRAIILRSLTFGAIVFIITGIFSIISSIITYLFAEIAGLQSNILSGVILAVLVTVFYKPLRDIIERATNTFLYKKSYDPDVLTAKVNQIAQSTLDFNHLLKSICGTLTEALHAEKIGVALLDKKGKLYIAYEDGFKPGVAAKLAKGNEQVMLRQFKRTPGIFVVDERKTEFENGENVDQIVSPPVMYAMAAQDLALIVPLRLQDKLIGVVAIGTKKSGEPYGSQDLRVLNLISGQFAVSIENALLFEEQKHFAEILKDEIRKATEELRGANAELKRMDESKSEFISIASHQLRTPLTVIKGFISMINEQAFGKVPALIKTQLEKVYASNERLIAMVEDLLDISRIESGRQEYLWKSSDLYALASSVVENLTKNAQSKGLQLVLAHAPEKLPKVVCDSNKLHEVMMNFVDNAVKYTKAGNVNIQLEAKPAGMVTFSVKDSGMGISKDDMGRLFQKFSRAKGSFLVQPGGSGLGLYVAKKIIDVHEGKIWAESAGAGKGSTFAFSIPIAGPKVRPQPPDRKVKIKTPEQLAEEARR